MGIVKKIITKLTSKKYKPSSSALGNPILKPSEITKQTGGYLSTNDPRSPSTYGATSTNDFKSASDLVSSGGGGSGSRSGGSSSGGSSGGIQESLRSSGITDSSSGRLKQSAVVSQQSLRDKEIYNPRKNQYETIRTNLYGQGTNELVNIRPPTPQEQERFNQIEKTDVNVRAGVRTASNVFGGVFTEQLTDEQREKISGGGYWNPSKQFETAKENIQFERDYQKAVLIDKKLEMLNKDYEQGKISYDSYSTQFDYYSTKPEYLNVVNSPERKNVYERISESNLDNKQKFGASVLTGAGDFIGFVSPVGRVVRGGEAISSGIEAIPYAQTSKQQRQAVGNIFIGSALVGSGVSVGTSLFGGLKGSGKNKVIQKTVSYGLPVGVSSLYGASIYSQTKDLPVSIGAGLGGFSGITVPGESIKMFKSNLETLKIDKYGGKSKTKQIQEQISKNRFDKLKEAFESTDAKVKRDLLNKKNAKEQTKYLVELSKKLKTPEEIKNFKEYVQTLYEQGIFQGVPLDYVSSSKGNNVIFKSILGFPEVKTERQEQNIISLEPQKDFVQISDNKINQMFREESSQKEKQNIFFRSGTKTKQTQPQKQEVLPLLKESQTQKQNQKQEQKISQLFRTNQKTDQTQRLLQRLAQATQQRTTQKTSQKFTTGFFQTTKGFSSPEKKVSLESLFKVFGKRFGKDSLIGTAKTKEGAEKELKNFLTGTLGRSGKISKDDKILSFEELNFGEMFRPAKRDKSRVVQKAKYSLGTGSEISEIQLFKRKGSKSKNLFGI